MFSVLPLSLFAFKLVKMVHLYRTRVGANLSQTLAAGIAGLSRSHTIGSAIVAGFRAARPAVLPHAEACAPSCAGRGSGRSKRGSHSDAGSMGSRPSR